MNSQIILREAAIYFELTEQEQAKDRDAEFAKIPEGTVRRRDGVDYELKNSRWHKVEVQSEPAKKPPNTNELQQFMS